MLLDTKIEAILKDAPLAKMKIMTTYMKNLSIYGKQDTTLGIYFDMLTTAVSVFNIGANLKLELYKKMTGLLRDNSITVLHAKPVAVPPGTGLAFYYGSGAQDITAAEIQANLNRDIAFKANMSYKFSPTLEHFIFAAPVAYGLLTSILDQNNFETFPAGWDVTTEDFNIAGDIVPYYVWRFKNLTTQQNFIINFIY